MWSLTAIFLNSSDRLERAPRFPLDAHEQKLIPPSLAVWRDRLTALPPFNKVIKMILLDGKKLAAALQQDLRRKTAPGSLEAVLVGDNPASVMYLQKKGEMAKSLGVPFHLHRFSSRASEASIIKKIEQLNTDRKVAGIIVQLPLPKKFRTEAIVNSVAVNKDIDGLNDENIATSRMLPATAEGILKLLSHYRIRTKKRKIVLVGFTRLLNIPLSIYFTRQGNRVAVVQEHTKNMAELKNADIIITAAGKPKLITGRWVKQGAVVVDAGISRIGKRVVGDVDFDSVSKKASYLTPVPGGVGPMTVVSLFANLFGLRK